MLVALGLVLALAGCQQATPIAERSESESTPRFRSAVDDGYNQNYPVGEAISPLRLPAAIGGDGTLRYSLPNLPPGLSFDSSTRTLTGTPNTIGTYRMQYRVADSDTNSSASDSATLNFTITVSPQNSVVSVVAAVHSGSLDGTAGALRFAPLPEASGGPVIAEVTGTQVITSGSAFFLDVAADRAIAKLLVAIARPNDERGSGYYELDLRDRAAAAQRLVGLAAFDLDPDLLALCLMITALDATGAAGPPVCHRVVVAEVGGGDLQVTVSWDTDADLDLHVVDPNGDEVYYARTSVESGGELDLTSNIDCRTDRIRNEHVAWTDAAPPAGVYVARVNHYENCGAAATNYVVRVYNHGHTSAFSGKFTGGGNRGGQGDGEVVTLVEVAGGGPPPLAAATIANTYRGSGDQVFVLNPKGEILDDTLYTLHLGNASPEVYLIASNTAHYPMDPHVERLDLREAAAKGLRAVHTEHQRRPRPPLIEEPTHLPQVTEFNNNPPLDGAGSLAPRRARQQEAREPVAEGDTFTFLDLEENDLVEIPATARAVVADGATKLAVWVTDREWGGGCAQGASCVTQPMVDAVAGSFLLPGAGNDIYDWVTDIFGEPWGAHDNPLLISAQAGDEIHLLLYDINGDGAPRTGEARVVGFFWGINNYLRQPDRRLLRASNERLMFVIDAPVFATRNGPTWEVTDPLPSTVIGTLAHEFQHMIHFYQKPILRAASSETWLNEMASEVAEDLIADKIRTDGPRGVAYHDPTAGEPDNSKGRLPGYNLYNDIQVTSWGRDRSLANYSINYAFGAYLARNYGGAALFSKIVQSDRAGVDAIAGAVRDLGHDAIFGELLGNWAAATLLSDNTAATLPYRYNAGTWSTSQTAGGTTYRLGSINLFNYVYGSARGIPERLALEGPYLYSLQGLNERTLPPHSNTYATLGRNTGTIRLNVSAVADNRITVVVKQ